MKPYTETPQALEAIPIHIVAGIAAQLSASEPDPVERVRQAYTLLDIAESGRYGLEKQRCFHAGLGEYCEERRMDDFIEKRRIDPLSVFNKKGAQLEVDFETALSKMFGRSVEKKDREPRLALYIQTQWLDDRKEFIDSLDEIQRARLRSDLLITDSTATDIISDWKKHGIPYEIFCDIRDALPEWWKSRLSNAQAVKRKGKTKGKQGRVVRKNDKRKGSRAGSILKRLKKTA